MKGILETLVDFRDQERGCIHYDLQQDNTNSASFMIIEYCASHDALDFHMEQPDFKDFRIASKYLIGEFSVRSMTHIN